jgi:type IV pilus assembly protein PilM
MLKSRRRQEKTIVGLEMDPSHLAAAQVEVNGKLSVTKGAVVDLRPGIVRDGEVADPVALTEELRKLFADSGLPTEVRLGVANQRIVVRTLDVAPLDDPKALEELVRAEAPDHIPVPMDEAVLDFQPLGLIETTAGPRMRVVIVAVRRDMIDRMIACTQEAGLQVVGIDLSAFAMVRALGNGDPAPTLFLSIGGLSNLAIAEEGTVTFTRVSGSGLEGMAGVLAERRQIPVEEARQLLVTVGVEGEIEPGSEEEAGMARSVLSEGVRRIAQEARASLHFHESAATGTQSVERVVLTGAVVGIPGFVKALAEELDLPVTPGIVPGGLSDAHGARFAVAAGLAVEEVQAA